MSDKITIRSSMKDKKNFTELPDLRKGIIDVAPTTPLMANYAVNSVANCLHPAVQYLKVKQFEEMNKNIFIYILEPDASMGTAKIAYFRPGQVLDIYIENNGVKITGTYTICSSPLRSTINEYVIILNNALKTDATDFITTNFKNGTKVQASAPYGLFYYQAIRDNNHIVAICDNTGYEPFLSMAESIADGTLNVDLTLIYTARKHSDIIMAERFEELSQTKHFKFVIVLSDEHVFKCERGFITKSLIEKYAPTNKYSLFINASDDVLKTTAPHIEELNLESHRIRYNK